MWPPFRFLLLVEFAASVTRFTNIECEVLDRSLTSFKECELKILGRGIVGLNIHMKIYNTTIKNVKQNISLWRRYNGFRPFMFNKTFDFCKFMANSNNKLSFEKIVLNTIREYSNINHTCPYGNDIIIQNLVLKEDNFAYLPLPSGEYRIQIMMAFNNIWINRISAQLLTKENLMISK